MSHEVENMFSVVETPWHGLGTIVNQAPNVQDAIELAGLNWSVSKEKLFTIDGRDSGAYALQRDTDKSILSVVGEHYTPLQNSESFQWFNPFLETGECSLETAGSLRQGQRIWVLAKLNRSPIDVGNGDLVNKYLLLSNGHDGILAARVSLTPIRVVCANTLSAAHNDKGSSFIRVKHSRQVKENLDSIRDIINTTDATFEATAEKYRYLTTRQVNTKDIEKYVKTVFELPEIVDTDRQKASQDALIKNIEYLFKYGKGQDLKSANGTAWGMYNAVTEYLSYKAGRVKNPAMLDDLRHKDQRLNNLWFGSNKTMNETALEEAIKIVA